MKQSYGYGTYIFSVTKDYEKFDKNTVLGLFTY